ncbi:MAG: ornithine cyclodeaminase family protein [Acidimicrobiia bacterium]
MTGRALVLSMRDVKELLDMGECIAIQEDVFARNGAGTAWNGENAWIFPDAELMRYPSTGKMMSGAIEPDWWGMKLLGVGEGGPDDRARMQVLCLFRAETLTPVAVVEANYLGHVRTGAGAAVASRHLARPEARRIGVLGTGATARFALQAHAAMGWPVDRVQVYSRTPERRLEYARELGAATGYDIEPVADPEEVVRGAEILVTGTASHEPAFDAAWVQPGTHVNAMGQRQEIPPELFLRSRNIGDEVAIATADGKLSVAIELGVITPEHAHGSLGEVIVGKADGRTEADQVTLFDSSGLCVQDIAAGVHVWERAVERGMGVRADLFHDDPLW